MKKEHHVHAEKPHAKPAEFELPPITFTPVDVNEHGYDQAIAVLESYHGEAADVLRAVRDEYVSVSKVDGSAPRRPVIGDRVLYVLADGQHRPADVVNAFHQRANLTVHLDCLNDLQPTHLYLNAEMRPNPLAGICKKKLVPGGATSFPLGHLSVGSADYDETGKTPGTWKFL